MNNVDYIRDIQSYMNKTRNFWKSRDLTSKSSMFSDGRYTSFRGHMLNNNLSQETLS